MKKLLLTLGTVAAVAAPVASVVACGTTDTAQSAEFQQLTVAGVTFDDAKTPSLATKLKGSVFVTMANNKTFLVPLKDVTEVAAAKANATLKDKAGNTLYEIDATTGKVKVDTKGKKIERKAGTTDQESFIEITGDSKAVLAYAEPGNKVVSIIKDEHVVVALKAEVAKINAGKAGEVEVISSEPDAEKFIKANSATGKVPSSSAAADAKFDHIKAGKPAKTSPLEAAASALFNNIFKKQADAEALAKAKTAGIKGIVKPSVVTKGSPTKDEQAALDLYDKQVASINGAADQDALTLAIANL